MRCRKPSPFLLVVTATFCCSTVTGLLAVNGTMNAVGSDVVLQCTDVSFGDVVQWTKNGAKLANSTKYTIVADGGNSTLTVHGIGEADVGPYRCSVVYGAYADVFLLSRPVATALSKSTAVTSGDTLVVNCSGWGYPTPYVLWTREKFFDHIFGNTDPEVTLTDVVTSNNVTLKAAGLQIAHINSSDQMTYMCFLRNQLGTANTTTLVRVKDRLAALWPFIGIAVEALLLVVLIVLGEFLHAKKC